MSIRRLIATAGSGLVIALVVGAPSPLQAQGRPDDLNADSKFIREVASDNLLEIRLGTIAKKKATNPAVQQFADRMVTDHTWMLENWRSLVTKSGFPFQPGLRDEQEREVKRLEKMSGGEFDRAYMTVMIQDHQNAIVKFQNARNTANSEQVRTRTSSDLPTLHQHLSLATEAGSQVGVSNVAVTTPNPPVGARNPPIAQEDVSADSEFLHQAAADNLLEIRLGQMAASKAEDPAVKQYAQRVTNDHTIMHKQWTTLASRNGVTLTAEMGPQHKDKADRLERLSGREFDRAYMTTELQNQQDYVNFFSNQGRATRSSQVRDLAANDLRSLQLHLSQARDVANRVGAPTTIAAGQNAGSEDLQADREFIRDVSAINTMEIRLGKMAQEKAKADAVKRFADRMVTDHTRLQDEWASMASSNQIPFKPGMGRLHQQKVDRLKKVSGEAFDRAYMTTVFDHHQAVVRYFEKEGRSARSSQVRQLVAADLPTLQEHLRTAREVARDVGANVQAASKGRVSLDGNK
jgi:putative membrane protein